MSFLDTMKAREKELEPLIQRAMGRVRGAAPSAPKIVDAMFYGAIGIDPKHLVVWYIFARDRDKQRAESDGLTVALERNTRAALRDEGYPDAGVDQMQVAFASNEEIARGGGWDFFR